MENETGLDFIGTQKINEDIDIQVSSYNVTEDQYILGIAAYDTQFLWFNSQNVIFYERYDVSYLSFGGKTYDTLFSNNNLNIYFQNLENKDTYISNYGNVLKPYISPDGNYVGVTFMNRTSIVYVWNTNTNEYIGFANNELYSFDTSVDKISDFDTKFVMSNNAAFSFKATGFIVLNYSSGSRGNILPTSLPSGGLTADDDIYVSSNNKFIAIGVEQSNERRDYIYEITNLSTSSEITFNGITLGDHYLITSSNFRTKKAFSPDETLLIESLPDLGIVKVWEWDDTNSIWNQKGQTLMEQDYSQTYSSLIGDSYKDLNLGSGTGFGRSIEINISSDRIKIEDNNDNLYIFDMNQLAPDTWNLQYTTNMDTQYESYNTSNKMKEVVLYKSIFLQDVIMILPVEYAEVETRISKVPLIQLDIQLGIIPESINVYRSLYYYNEVDSSGNLIGDFTETSNDNASIDWNTNSIHSWTDTNDSNGKFYTIQSEDWRYRLKVEAVYAGQTYIGYINGINNKGIELPLSGYSMTNNTITSTSEDINVKIIFVSLEGDYYKIDFEDNIFDYNILTFYDSNETNYSLIQINNRDIYVPDSYNINEGIVYSDNTSIQKQFQWFRNGVAITTIQDYNDTIDTGYTLTADDIGQTITVKLTYSEQEFENNGIDLSDTIIVDSNIDNIDCDLRTNTEIYLTGIENTVSFLSNPTISVDSNIVTTGELQISGEGALLNITPYDILPPSESEGVYNQFGRIFYYNTDIHNSDNYNGATNKRGISNTEGDDTVIDWRVNPRNIAISGNDQIFAISFFKEKLSFTLFYNKNDMKAFSWIEDPDNNQNSYIGNRTKLSYDGEYFLTCAYNSRLYDYYLEDDMQFRSSSTTNTGFVWLYRKNSSTNIYEPYKYDFHNKMVDANDQATTGINDINIRIFTCDMSDDAQFIIVGGYYLAALFQWNDETEDYDIVKLIPYTEIIGTTGSIYYNTRDAIINSDGTMFAIKGLSDEQRAPLTVYEWTGNSTSNIGSNPKRDDFVQIFQELDSTVLFTTGYPSIKGNFIGVTGSNLDYLVIYEYTPRNGDTQGSVVQRGSKINNAKFPEINTRFIDQEVSGFDITNDGMIVAGTSYNKYIYIFKYSEEVKDWTLDLTIYDEISATAGNLTVVRLFEDGTVLTGGYVGLGYIVNYNYYTNYLSLDYGLNVASTDNGSNIKYTPSITNGVDTPRFIFSDSTTNLLIQKDFNISVFTSTAPIADTNDTQLETRMTVGKTPPSLIINPNDYFTDADLNDQFQTDSLSFTIGASNYGTSVLDSNTFEIEYTPNSDLTEDTSDQLTIIATDKYGLTGEKTININIVINYAPTFVGEATTLNMYKVENLSETFTIHCLTLFTDTANDSLTFSVDSNVGLQYGSMIIDNDRILYTVDSNINTQTTDTIQITATDTLNESVTQLFDIVIGIALDNTSTTVDVPKYPRLNPDTDTNLYNFSLKHTPGVETRLVIDAWNYFYEINTNDNYNIAFSGTGTYGKIDKPDSLEPTFTKNRPTGSFSLDFTPPRYYNGYELITFLTFNEENNFRQGPFFIQSQDRGYGENFSVRFNIDDNPINVMTSYGSYERVWIVQKPDGTYTFMSQYEHTEYYLTSDLNMSETDIENSLSLTIESNLNGTFSFIPSTSPTQYLVTDSTSFIYIGDTTGLYFLYDTVLSNIVRYIVNDDVTGNVQDQVTLIATNEWNLTSEVTININIETVSSPLPSTFDITQYIGQTSEIVTIENISDYFLDVSGTISSFHYKQNIEWMDDTITDNILTHTISSTYMIKSLIVEVVPFMIYGGTDDFSDSDFTNYRIEKKFNINVEVTDIIATVDSSDATFILNKAQGYEGTILISNISQYFIPLNSSDIMTYSATSQFGEITIDTDLNLTYTYNENITENTIDEIVIRMTNQDNYFARKTINIDIQFYIPENMQVESIGGTSEILLSTLFPDIYFDPEASLIAHYEFNDSNNIGKCSINSGNDLINSGSITTSSDAKYDMSAYFTSDGVLYTNNIDLANSTHTISFWVKSLLTDNYTFFYQGETTWNESLWYFASGATGVLGLRSEDSVFVTDDAGLGEEGNGYGLYNNWHMHTIVIRSDGIKRIYIDGQLEAETVISSTEESTSQQDGINHPIFTIENQPFIIGGIKTSSGYYPSFNGYMDDFRVYDIELSAKEISYLFGAQQPQAIIDSNFGLQYGNAIVNEEISKIIYTADSNLDGFSFNDIFKVEVGEAVIRLIAHYEFKDPSNVGKCSVDSANDLILFDGAIIVTNTFTDSPLSYNSGADFSSNTDGKGLIMNNINLGNLIRTISFWAKQPSTNQCIFFAQGHHINSLTFYGSSNSGKLYLRTNSTTFYPATQDSNITTTGASTSDASSLVGSWHMHTIVIRDDGVKKLYIDGQFYSSTETANVTNEIFTNELNGYLTIGGLLETGTAISNPTEEDLTPHSNNDFRGYMQDFRIYNGELSEENINDLYNSTLEVFAAQEKIVTVDIITDEPPTADTNETIFTIGQTIGDESITTTVDVTPYFTDNGPLTYSVDTNYGATTGSYVFENNNIIYTTDSNMTDDVIDQINIIAQDEVGQTVEKVITFNVIANNKPEADTNVLSYDIYDLTIPVIVDVTDIFSDIDSDDILTITIDTTYGLTNGTAVIEDNNLSYLASVDIKDNRTDEVKLVVTDSFNATAEKILNINISPIIVQSDVNIVVYKNTPKILNLEDYITSGILLSSTVDETYGLANGFIRKDSNTPSFCEYNPRLNVIESDIFKIILNSTIELIVNIQMESGIIEANFVEGDTNLIIEAVPGEDPKVDLSQFVSNPAEKPLEIEVTQDVLEQIKGEINIDSNTNEITYVPDENVSGPQTIIFEVKIFD